MLKYILKRILVFIPTLIIISLMAFMISVNAPGDPVERLLTAAEGGGNSKVNKGDKERQRREIRQKLGLDIPVFYFSLGTAADCDTLYKIPSKEEQISLQRITRECGDWSKVSDYYYANKKILALQKAIVIDTNIEKKYPTLKTDFTTAEFTTRQLFEATDDTLIRTKYDTLTSLFAKYPSSTNGDTINMALTSLKGQITTASTAYKAVKSSTDGYKKYIPKLMLYGIGNQYHRWAFGNCDAKDHCDYKSGDECTSEHLKYNKFDTSFVCGRAHKYDCGKSHGVITGDWGLSYRDQQPISKRIGSKIKWSFILSMLSIFLAYIISIPLGIYAAYKRNSIFDRVSSVILFMLYSLPSFFVGTLLLVWFANPDNLNWFPSAGIQDDSTFNETWGLWASFKHHAPYLVLPLIIYTYSSLAFLSRQMRVGMVEVLGQDFIRTARAKGLDEKTVVLKHALRNGLLPVITIFASVFPAAIGGSVIVETMFSIPGIGLEIFESIQNYDYPMIVAVFTISGFLTLIGYLVSDILYAVVDPRISYK